jgi:hypothetical protein
MLEVTFSLWFTCNCWKMSPWNQEEFSLSPSKSSWIGHACAEYSWDGRLLPPFQWKLPMHNKPLTDLFKNEKKKSKTFTIFFHVLPSRTWLYFIARSSWCCNCLLAIEILLIFLEFYIVAISWESSNAIPMASIETFPFRHTKTEVWFHLTRAESQAPMMVSVPQGFDIGLFEIRQGWCCGWHNLPEGLIRSSLDFSWTTTLHEDFMWLILKVTLWSLFLILKSDLYLMTDWRLVISWILVSRTSRRTW